MPLTPIPGITRLRAFQLGLESTFKTPVAATRRMPWTATPTIQPNWTFPSADTGTLDMAIAPFRKAFDVTFQSVGQLFANDVPTIQSAGVMGGITLSGTPKTFTTTPHSTSQDVFDTYTGEWFDDASASGDSWQCTGGVIERIQLHYVPDQGPIDATCDWRFAEAVYGATPTGSLNVDTAPVPMFMADTEFYVNDTYGAIETTKLTDICYEATIDYVNNLDIKRFANGSNTRFQVQNYGRGERVITFTLHGAKQTAWIAEVGKWIADNPVERFWGLKTTSTVIAGSGIPYSMDIRIPGYWMNWSALEVNTNTAIQLEGHQIYDTNLAYPFYWKSTSTRAAL